MTGSRDFVSMATELVFKSFVDQTACWLTCRPLHLTPPTLSSTFPGIVEYSDLNTLNTTVIFTLGDKDIIFLPDLNYRNLF